VFPTKEPQNFNERDFYLIRRKSGADEPGKKQQGLWGGSKKALQSFKQRKAGGHEKDSTKSNA